MPYSKVFDTPDTQKHPRMTIMDENGKVYLADLVNQALNPQPTMAAFQVVTAAASTITATTNATAIYMGVSVFPAKIILIHNSLDQAVVITVNGQDFVRCAKASEVIDLSPAKLAISAGVTIGVYKQGTTPASGEISITLLG